MSHMTTYVGTKVVRAKPMTRLEYNNFRNWVLPSDENGDDEGYLVEYVDGGKANTEAYSGYISWSPKDVFERAYKVAKSQKAADAEMEKPAVLSSIHLCERIIAAKSKTEVDLLRTSNANTWYLMHDLIAENVLRSIELSDKMLATEAKVARAQEVLAAKP